MMDTWFPNPAEHAPILIEVCGSLYAAQTVAAINVEFAADAKEYRYWNSVAAILETHPCGAN
jgi:hypothetical protein